MDEGHGVADTEQARGAQDHRQGDGVVCARDRRRCPCGWSRSVGVYSCVESNIPDRWDQAVEVTAGAFNPNTGPLGWLGVDAGSPPAGTSGRNIFGQVQDNNSNTNPVSAYIQVEFEIGPCTKLELSYMMKWGRGLFNGSPDNAVGQAITISTQVGGGDLVPQRKYYTRNIPAGNVLFTGGTELAGSQAYSTPGTWYSMPTYSVENTSTSPSTVRLRYTFDIPGLNSRRASDDIYITSPLGVCSPIDGCVPAPA